VHTICTLTETSQTANPQPKTPLGTLCLSPLAMGDMRAHSMVDPWPPLMTIKLTAFPRPIRANNTLSRINRMQPLRWFRPQRTAKP
jgi:hypothetical protein